MQNLRVGHCSKHEHGTGISAFLFDKPAQGAYQLCGSSPASHELHVLDMENSVTHVDGLVFTGGSAFGLSVIEGVMRWFQEQGRGVPALHGAVPIVPIAGIYDLGVKQAIPPTREDAYEACKLACVDNIEQGQVGAGTGASVGKLVPNAHSMSSGIGRAEITLADGLQVVAYAVVNAVGDVRDANNTIIAGASYEKGKFADCEKYLLSGQNNTAMFGNTTLVAVFTNAKFSKAELKRIAKMAIAGMARAISPVFTCYDGDLLFCFSLGEKIASELIVGAMAVEAVRQAIVNSVNHAVIL
jgi:L-aminopeptidase/D-esterase-like protein